MGVSFGPTWMDSRGLLRFAWIHLKSLPSRSFLGNICFQNQGVDVHRGGDAFSCSRAAGVSFLDPHVLCLAIWWDRELAIANSQSQLGSRELSAGISAGILIRGFSQSQLEPCAGTCHHMASICWHMPA